jgi:hypothetical protein
MKTLLVKSTLSAALIALLTACGGTASTGAPAETQPKAEATQAQPKAPTEAPPEQTNTEAAAPAASSDGRYKLLKNEKLSAELVELPGIPSYPGAQSVDIPGMGSKMVIGGATTANYVLEGDATWPQVFSFYKSKLEADGWKIHMGEQSGTEDLPIAIMLMGKGDQVLRISFTNGAQQGTGPRMSILYTAKK